MEAHVCVGQSRVLWYVHIRFIVRLNQYDDKPEAVLSYHDGHLGVCHQGPALVGMLLV